MTGGRWCVNTPVPSPLCWVCSAVYVHHRLPRLFSGNEPWLPTEVACFVTRHHWFSFLSPLRLPTQATSDLPPDYFYHLKLLLYFWLHWVFIAACRLFSSCGERRLLSGYSAPASHCSNFSSCGSRASVVAVHGFSCSAACRILVPRPGIKPVSPALAGGFLTTGPPGKSHIYHSDPCLSICFWGSSS